MPVAIIGDVDVPGVREIRVEEGYSLVRVQLPGTGNLVINNMGREPITVVIEGIIFGDKAQDTIEKLRNLYYSGAPLIFTSDATSTTRLNKVVFFDFHIDEDIHVGIQAFPYRIVLKETQWIDPQTAKELQKKQEMSLADQVAAGALRDKSNLVNVQVEIVDPDGKACAWEYDLVFPDGSKTHAMTDASGKHLHEMLPDGTYKVEPKKEEIGDMGKEEGGKGADMFDEFEDADGGGDGAEGEHIESDKVPPQATEHVIMDDKYLATGSELENNPLFKKQKAQNNPG